uniref:Uncharacterized protein n=1 Tax=Ananas comosus var. bracteatus TaxID=296719 RepID=A0A6V7NWC4_ANACO|nr:unnamed protein product [Ananas comosus var. bracteatus]
MVDWNDLVYVKYNRALMRRYNLRDTIDPIVLNDVDDSNEWLPGVMDSDGEGDNEKALAWEDDTLTWVDVARAAGVNEHSHHTRFTLSMKGLEKGKGIEKEKEKEKGKGIKKGKDKLPSSRLSLSIDEEPNWVDFKYRRREDIGN